MPRYFMRIMADGVEVYDSEIGDANHDDNCVYGPRSWDEASREAHKLNDYSFLSPAPPTVCPDCVKYRAALLEIARTAGEAHVLRLANELLDTTGASDG
jgi:hypothetical protein